MNEQQVGVDPAPISPEFLQRAGFTRRVLLVGAVLIPLNVYWVVYMERIRYLAGPTAFSLLFNAVFTLLLLQVLNLALRRLRPAIAFSQGELLLIYSMVCVGTAIVGNDFVQSLIPLYQRAAPPAVADQRAPGLPPD